jgi:hypothetical protein
MSVRQWPLTGENRGMTDLPKVISPLAAVGEREGVELVLVSVEAWPDEIVVRLRGLPRETTDRLDAQYGTALEKWHREGHEGSPPQQPAERMFPDVSVADDVGTSYSPRSSARGRSGTMFRADYAFAPGPPETAESLRVRVGGVDGIETHIRLRPDG